MSSESSSVEVPVSCASSNLCGECGLASLSEMSVESGEGRSRSPASVEDDSFWIQCDVCERWFHGKCVDVEEYEGVLIEHYHCPGCQTKKGPSILKPVLNKHRYKFYEAGVDYKPPEIGTDVWVKNFKQEEHRILDGGDKMRYFDSGHQLTTQWLEKVKWDSPVIVKRPGGLGLRVPDYSLHDIVDILGESRGVDVIDVQTQHSFRMTMGRFLRHWEEKPRKRLYNLISLELTRTPMNEEVKIPDVVEEMSWVHNLWPRDAEGGPSVEILHHHLGCKPEVGKFCLVGMKDSFTDFHIDFGGSSVWYHVVRGKKIFYVIEPSDHNLAMFEQHGKDRERHEKFFGFQLPETECRRVTVNVGETLFIPAGWIHAVYTPADSLVYGGNFLQSIHIPMQLRVAQMEERLNTDDRFMFPNFKVCCWYAAKHLTETFHDANDSECLLETFLVEGGQELVNALKEWIKNEKSLKRKGDNSLIVSFGKAARSLQKEVTAQEKLKKERRNRKSESPKKGEEKKTKRKAAGASPTPTDKKRKRGKHQKKHTLKLKPLVAPPPLKLKLNLSESVLKVDDGGIGDEKPGGEKEGISSPSKESFPSDRKDLPLSPEFRFCNIDPSARKIFSESQGAGTDRGEGPSPGAEASSTSNPIGFSLVNLQKRSEGKLGLSSLANKQPAKPVISPIKIAREIHTASLGKKTGSPVTPSSSGLDISGIFGTSSHGRVQKPSRWITGAADHVPHSPRKSAEYVPELGQHCHTHADFVYPSLIDSDSEDTGGRSKGRKKKAPELPQPVFKIKEVPKPEEEEEHLVIDEQPQVSAPSLHNKPPKIKKEPGEPKMKKKAGSTAKQRLANKMKLHRFNIPL